MTKRTKQGKIANDEKMLARIEKLYDNFTPEDGVLVMMYVDKDQALHTYNIGNLTSCAATIATAVDDGYDLKNVGDSDATFTGRAIVEGINAVIARGGITGLRVAMKILKALRDAVLEKGKAKESSGDDFLSLLTDIAIKTAEKKDVDVRDEDDEEDCEHCKANKICPLPQAIAYRKANHLPNPNRKNRGKNGGCSNAN